MIRSQAITYYRIAIWTKYCTTLCEIKIGINQTILVKCSGYTDIYMSNIIYDFQLIISILIKILTMTWFESINFYIHKVQHTFLFLNNSKRKSYRHITRKVGLENLTLAGNIETIGVDGKRNTGDIVFFSKIFSVDINVAV